MEFIQHHQHRSQATQESTSLALVYQTGEDQDGIIKALTLASYEPMRVDLKEHNDKIGDVIISEIRRSKFLVADFTLHRPGVYFEAGYALGLGLPVIMDLKAE